MSLIRIFFLSYAVLAALMPAATAAPGEAPQAAQPAPVSSSDPAVAATTSDTFGLSWWSVDGGGGSSSGGGFTVTGTVGQPDAGTAAGHGQVADGGLWSGNRVTIFVDDLELGDTGRWSVVVP